MNIHELLSCNSDVNHEDNQNFSYGKQREDWKDRQLPTGIHYCIMNSFAEGVCKTVYTCSFNQCLHTHFLKIMSGLVKMFLMNIWILAFSINILIVEFWKKSLVPCLDNGYFYCISRAWNISVYRVFVSWIFWFMNVWLMDCTMECLAGVVKSKSFQEHSVAVHITKESIQRSMLCCTTPL